MPTSMETAEVSDANHHHDQDLPDDQQDLLLGHPISLPWQPRTRRRSTHDEFFLDGDIVCSLTDKLYLEFQEEEITRTEEFCCGVANCNKTFTSLNGYEVHYNSVHRNKCTACKRSFPTPLLLEIHLAERHDPMFEAKSHSQPMFQCLAQGCDKYLKTPEERKDHLIKIHKYPSNFRFDRTPKKSKKKKTNQIEIKGAESMEIESNQVEPPSVNERIKPPGGGDAESMVGQTHVSESGRKFVYKVPKSFSFGQGAQKAFQRHPPGGKKKKPKKHWHQQNTSEKDTTVNIEEVQMTDLEEALNT